MDTLLLATKLRIPPEPRRQVRRPRLVDALERSIPHHKLILLSAPAGYGKTTLLAQWAHASRYPLIWLSVSAEDNDFARFFRYLLTGWEQIQPGIRESPLGLLLGGSLPDREAVLSAFINIANDLTHQLVFVLEDYHLIEDPSLHEALTFLLDHLPPTLHFVLSSRAEPSLPLARYRARDELLEFRAADLQFLQEETAEFLSRLMGLDLSHDEVVKLHTRLEGWIAGLQLLALTLQRRLAGADTLVVSGKHRFIADYLSEDVLADLPATQQQFLLHTSILEHMCGSLCDTVTGKDGGQEMLEHLERANLFLVPLDDRREWFRYHQLFADFLQQELQRQHADEVAGLHRRAARWHLVNDLPEQAFRHAVEGDDVELVVQIVDLYLNAKLLGGEFRVVKRWLDGLREEWNAAYPVLGLARAGFLAYTGAFDACVRCVDEVEERLLSAKSKDTRWQLARVTAVRCFVACTQNDLTRAEAFADEALRELPEDELGFRPGIYAALGDTYRQHGRWEQARACYLKVLDLGHAPATRVQAAHVFGALADLALRQGHLRDANAYWRKALAAIQKRETWGHLPLPATGWVYLRLGEILYEQNSLTEAWEHLSLGLERAELGGDVRAMIAGYLIAARLKVTTGDIPAAAAYLERARPLVEQAPFADWVSRFDRLQLEIWLAQDQLRAAVNWTDQMLQGGEIERRPESAVAQLGMARALTVKGDPSSLERALTLLERLIGTAEAEGRAGVTIEALALRALAHWRCGEHSSAMIALERALRLAEPEGYVRIVADLGLPMARLLQEARSRAVLPDYVERLLTAIGDGLSVAPAHETLPEPLTAREQDVLELMVAGLTNREIAEELVISPETVKKHTCNIYGKLAVRSRRAAVARAKELALLD